MSLLAPARGMSTLPAKGGFSRPSSFTLCGVSSRPLGLRLLAPPKTFPPAGVSHIPVAARMCRLLTHVEPLIGSLATFSVVQHILSRIDREKDIRPLHEISNLLLLV